MPTTTTDEGLKRVIGIQGLSLNVINNTIGAGIFALPAIVGIALGSFAVFAYIFCGIMMASIMLCYAEIGTRVTSAGGSYAYVAAAFGNFAGFIINWLFVFAWGILGDAALMNVISDSLAAIFPVFLNPWIRGLLFFVLLGFMILINIRGTKQGVSFVKWITIIKLLPLLGIILFGFSHVNSTKLHWENLPSISTFGDTVLVLFFAFLGFESALCVSGEIKNPKRTIPSGIFLGAMVVLIFYLLLQSVTQGVLGTNMETVKNAPLAAVAEKIVGPVGGTLLLFAAAISTFGNVGGDIMNTPRVIFAGANDGLFPKILGRVHLKYATPHFAIIAYAALIFIFSVSGGFKQLAILASAAALLTYLAVILATLKLRNKKQDVAEKTFRVPGGLIIPLIGIAAIVWLLTSLSKWEILSTIIFIGIVCIIYYVMEKIKKEKVVDNTIEEMA